MDCTPEKCPHKALMEKARKACLACDHLLPSGRGGQVSYDAAGERLVHRNRLAFDNSPRPRATPLPPEVEDRTAELYRLWCALGTVDALLMLHMSNGGTCASFGEYLRRAAATIDAMDCGRDAFRATAWARFQSLVRRFKPFLRSKLHAWDDGHGGAVRKEREKAERAAMQGDLFGWRAGR